MKTLLLSPRLSEYAAANQDAGMKRTVNSFLFIISILFLITGCKKQDITTATGSGTSDATIADNMRTQQSRMQEGNVVKMYDNLSSQTLWELQQARSATAKYRNIENAVKDGYVDIAVDIQHMGHHYMNVSLVDSVFDIRHPEILVYNRNAQGEQELIAVEYAVPLTYPMPEGFTGSSDVWDGATGFPFWLVHAWVWKYNPDGAFKELNPLVDLN